MSRQLSLIPTMDKEAAIYLAGLTDGEGCFYIARNVRSNMKATYSPQFKIVLTDEATISWIANKLKREYTHIIANLDRNHQDTYVVRISDRIGMVRLIEQILPYMITKKEVAQNMMDYCKSRIENWGVNNSRKAAATYSPQELHHYQRIKELNAVGKMREVAHY